jgi:Domain of unknown function (DUF4062)
MEVDLTAAARRVDSEAARRWLEEQRVFISSAMADTAAERRAARDAIEGEGAQAVWFEELGRDASATEAYLTGVDSATIYVGILNEVYGTMLESGFSPTELEYMRARERGKRTVVYVAEDAPAREGHLIRFIERVRVFSTTENYRDADDLARRLRRRLHELAAEALSPWVKLDDLVFRADLIEEGNDALLLHARVHDDIAFGIERLRGEQWGRARVRLTYSAGVLDGEIASVKRTTRAGGTSDLEITLERVTRPQANAMRASFGGISPDDLVEAGLRHQLFGEPLPDALSSGFGFTAETGVDGDELRAAFALPNEIVEPIKRLVVTEGLVGGGHSPRVSRAFVGPRVGEARRLAVEWFAGGTGAHEAPARRSIEGDWRV